MRSLLLLLTLDGTKASIDGCWFYIEREEKKLRDQIIVGTGISQSGQQFKKYRLRHKMVGDVERKDSIDLVKRCMRLMEHDGTSCPLNI